MLININFKLTPTTVVLAAITTIATAGTGVLIPAASIALGTTAVTGIAAGLTALSTLDITKGKTNV